LRFHRGIPSAKRGRDRLEPPARFGLEREVVVVIVLVIGRGGFEPVVTKYLFNCGDRVVRGRLISRLGQLIVVATCSEHQRSRDEARHRCYAACAAP
jgi:hypothetical protein